MRLSKEALLAGCPREFAEVDIGVGTVRVRTLSAGEQLALEQALRKLHESNDLQAVMVQQLAAYVADDDGGPLLTVEEAVRMMALSPQAITKIVSAAQDLNRWTGSEREAVRGN